MSKIDRHKITFGFAVLLWSCIGSYYGQPLIHGNQDATNIIVTMFSILAGYTRTYNRLVRHKWLFKLYLTTLAFVFLSVLLKDKLQDYQVIIERIYLAFALAAFIFSLRLPSTLMVIQQERIEHEINERRKQEGIEED